jgi:cytochrome c-type biogenesis protein CcmH/NrfG
LGILLRPRKCFSKTRAPFYAGRIIRALLRNDRENARGWDLLGCLYRDHNNVNDALICARKAVKFEPRNAHYLTNLGTLLSEKQLMGNRSSTSKKLSTSQVTILAITATICLY